MFANIKSAWVEFWTSGRVALKHLGLALFLIVLIYIAYTLLRRTLPSPELLSPFIYLFAFIASLISYLRSRDNENSRFSFVVMMLCGLAFMDEISYGVEPGFVDPIYVEKYNVYIYDLHNLIGLLIELTQIFLRENNWNAELFAQFRQIDFVAILLIVAFIIVLRARRKDTNINSQILFLFSLFLLIAGGISVFSLTQLPTDPKNAWLFTYSISRVGMMVGIILLSSLPIAFLLYFKRASEFNGLTKARFVESFYSKNSLRRIQNTAWGVIFVAIIYQFWTPFVTYPDQKVIVARLTPVVAWANFCAAISITAVQAWQLRLTQPMKNYLDPIRSFIRANPSLTYAFVAVLLIVVAQVNDKGWLLIGDYFSISELGITDWGWWTEEIFELTAAFEFYAASLFYKQQA